MRYLAMCRMLPRCFAVYVGKATLGVAFASETVHTGPMVTRKDGVDPKHAYNGNAAASYLVILLDRRGV